MELKDLANNIQTDLKSIDIGEMLQAKNWEKIAQNHPEFTQVEAEITQWLESNCPTLFAIIIKASKRKRHDLKLINAIKASIIIAQNEYVGLRSADHNRLNSLYFDSLKMGGDQLEKAFGKNDLIPDLMEYNDQYFNAYTPYNLYGIVGKFSDELVWLETIALVKQPESEYLNLAKNLNVEAEVLKHWYKDIELLEFHPKNQSDYHLCACCFRWIRLKPSNRDEIAYHGYTIDREGYNNISSESCLGAKYKPLEISSEGTFYVLERNKHKLEKIEKELPLWKDNSSEMGKKYFRSLNNKKSSIKHYAELAVKMFEKYQPDQVERAKEYLIK